MIENQLQSLIEILLGSLSGGKDLAEHGLLAVFAHSHGGDHLPTFKWCAIDEDRAELQFPQRPLH